MKKIFNVRFFLICGLILLAAASRLLLLLPNFTPIMAIALFGAAYIQEKRLALAIPLTAMFLSDLILGFHNTMLAVYGSIALGVVLGLLLLKKVTIPRLLISALSSSIIFFIVTNFAVWLVGFGGESMYPNTFEGLAQCYTAALPFFRNSIFGDLVYTGVLFGSFALAEIYIPSLKPSVQS